MHRRFHNCQATGLHRSMHQRNRSHRRCRALRAAREILAEGLLYSEFSPTIFFTLVLQVYAPSMSRYLGHLTPVFHFQRTTYMNEDFECTVVDCQKTEICPFASFLRPRSSKSKNEIYNESVESKNEYPR